MTANETMQDATPAKEVVRELAGKAEEQVRRWAEDAGKVVTEKAGEFGGELTELVKKYPLQALLVGFGVGLLCGRAARA
jgi:ElaB/YqjD/DUF883 family membrane-anchored ribosome-binding protein